MYDCLWCSYDDNNIDDDDDDGSQYDEYYLILFCHKYHVDTVTGLYAVKRCLASYLYSVYTYFVHYRLKLYENGAKFWF